MKNNTFLHKIISFLFLEKIGSVAFMNKIFLIILVACTLFRNPYTYTENENELILGLEERSLHF